MRLNHATASIFDIVSSWIESEFGRVALQVGKHVAVAESTNGLKVIMP